MSTGPPRKLFCFGFGYTAEALARRMRGGAVIAGTSRHAGADPSLVTFDGTARSPDVAHALEGTTDVLLSIPPSSAGDPVLIHHGVDLAALGTVQWIGYLSTIGVYGDAGGGWVDEDSPLQPLSDRSRRRFAAEEAWRRFGRDHGRRVQIFRLPGIYGPGRSAIDGVRSGAARRIVKPGQVFNRIHVDDIAAALDLAMAAAREGRPQIHDTFNVVDDEAAPPQDVIAHAARLLARPPPPEVPIEMADLSEMARSFYQECKRVRNGRLKAVFGWQPAFPTYREGLGDIAAQG